MITAGVAARLTNPNRDPLRACGRSSLTASTAVLGKTMSAIRVGLTGGRDRR